MKKWKNILVGFSVLALLVMPVIAAENGCDNDDNDMIVAELALCSTHAYNIGNTENPSGADKGLMRDVIAMKTTVITQQMYKQYEQMESMLRRLKTQLEKAILTTSLEAKGASSGSGGGSSSSSSGGSYKSNDRNIHMAGVQNCLNFYQDEQILRCYQDNLNAIVNVSGNGSEPSTELKKQLVQDYCALDKMAIGDLAAGSCIAGTNKTEGGETYGDLCSGKVKPNRLNKRDFQKWIDDMRSCLQNKYRAYNNQERRYQDNRR